MPDVAIMTQALTGGALTHLYGSSVGMGKLSESGLRVMMTGNEKTATDGFFVVFSPAVSESVLSEMKKFDELNEAYDAPGCSNWR